MSWKKREPPKELLLLLKKVTYFKGPGTHSGVTRISTQQIVINASILGQLISKCLFGVFNFFQKTNENKSTTGTIVVKSNSFVRFLEETSAWKNHFDFVWPLGAYCPNIYTVVGHLENL